MINFQRTNVGITAEDVEVGGGSLKPGVYAAELIEVKSIEPTQADPNWVRARIQLELSDHGKETVSLMLPTTDAGGFAYGPRKSTFPFKTLVNWAGALAGASTIDEVIQFITDIASGKYVGAKFNVAVSYSKAHPEARGAMYVLVSAKGDVELLDGKLFLTDDAAIEAANVAGIPASKFSEIRPVKA